MLTKQDTSDRELIITRLLDAPRELVWEVFTRPQHIKQWWGPNGFTNTIDKMEVRPEGIWEFVMHGPDGTDYKNKSIYKEVVKYERIVFEHVSGPKFITTLSFEDRGDKTFLKWHMLFGSKEEFIQVVKTFKADEGLKQNVEKLNAYVQAQLNIHNQLKTNKMSRTSTYLNFPGNTEEAFNFYKKVFKSDFNGGGIQRFGDIPPG